MVKNANFHFKLLQSRTWEYEFFLHDVDIPTGPMTHSTKYYLLWIIVLHPTHLPPVAAHEKHAHTLLCSQEAPIPITLSGLISTIEDNMYLMRSIIGTKYQYLRKKKKGWFGRYGVHAEGRKWSRNKGWGSCSTVTWSYDSWQMPGAAEEGCMQIRQSTGQGKNVKRDSKRERTERTGRGHGADRNTGEDRGHKNRQKQSDFSSDTANTQVLEAIEW